MSEGRILSSRMQVFVLTLGLLSLIASLVSSLYGEKIAGPRSRRQDSYGAGPLGHRAFVELLERLSRKPHRYRANNHATVGAPLFFFEPNLTQVRPGDNLDLSDLLAARCDEYLPTLVVLPKWGMRYRLGGRRGAELLASEKVQSILQSVCAEMTPGPRLVRRSLPGPKHISGGNSLPGVPGLVGFKVDLPSPQLISLPTDEGQVLVGTRNAALVVRYPDAHGSLLLVSDPDLIHNFNFFRRENAALMHALVSREFPDARILVDEVFHGHAKSRTLGAALGEFPAVLIMVAALLFALAGLAAGLRRFGVPIPLPPRRGRGPAEVVEVVAGLRARGERADFLAATYVDEVMTGLAEWLRIPEGQKRAGLAKLLDQLMVRRGGKPGAEKLMATAERIKARRRRLGEVEALRFAQAAWAFSQKLNPPVHRTEEIWQRSMKA